MSSPCYCITLRTASRKMAALYDAALAPVGVNIGQFSMLRRIRRHGPVSLTELGRLTELDRSTVGRNAKVLERMALLRTIPAADQREAALVLTAAGEAVLQRGGPLWDGVQAQIEARLGGTAAAQLQAQLQAF